MDLIVGQRSSLYFLRKATYNLKFGVEHFNFGEVLHKRRKEVTRHKTAIRFSASTETLNLSHTPNFGTLFKLYQTTPVIKVAALKICKMVTLLSHATA